MMYARSVPLLIVILIAAVSGQQSGAYLWPGARTNMPSRQSEIETILAKSGNFNNGNTGVGLTNCQEKVALMFTDEFSFYRANNPLFYNDMKTSASVNRSSVYKSGNATTWLCGDMHMINMGTYDTDTSTASPTDANIFAINDYDESWTGHWLHDVYRLAASFVLAGRNSSLSSADINTTVKNVANQYFTRLNVFKGGDSEDTYEVTSSIATTFSSTNNPVLDLISGSTKGSMDTRRKDMLDGYSTTPNGKRTFQYTGLSKSADIKNITNSTLRTALINAIGVYASQVTKKGVMANAGYFNVEDVAYRVAAGLGSYGIERYYAIIEGATTSGGDGRILDIKLQRFPSPRTFGGLTGSALTSYPSNLSQANRTQAAYKALIYRADDHIGTLTFDGKTYSVRERSPNKDSLATTGYTATMLKNVACMEAMSLAGAHSKQDGKGVNTFETQAYNDINSLGVAKFATELTNFAVTYADQVRTDFAIFKTSYNANKALWCGTI